MSYKINGVEHVVADGTEFHRVPAILAEDINGKLIKDENGNYIWIETLDKLSFIPVHCTIIRTNPKFFSKLSRPCT
jgi:hypothetical protein